jgi:hypothetical protein
MKETAPTVCAEPAAGKSARLKRPHVPPAIRAECRARGIDPAFVADVKAALRDQQDNGPLRRREMRQMAWQKMKPPGCWPFWRHGFRAHYGKRVDDHDYTAIPNYDELHAEVSAEFPEWAEDEYGFFCELLSPCPRLETAAELWERAIGEVIRAMERGEFAQPAATAADDGPCDF